MTVERVFASVDQKVCEDWAKNQAEQIWGKGIVSSIRLNDTFRPLDSEVSISVLESERE